MWMIQWSAKTTVWTFHSYGWSNSPNTSTIRYDTHRIDRQSCEWHADQLRLAYGYIIRIIDPPLLTPQPSDTISITSIDNNLDDMLINWYYHMRIIHIIDPPVLELQPSSTIYIALINNNMNDMLISWLSNSSLSIYSLIVYSW